MRALVVDPEAEGKLRLDSRSGWERGGKSGPAIVPGNPDESLLVRAIRYNGGEYEMPPDGKLPKDAIRLIGLRVFWSDDEPYVHQISGCPAN